jgi:hypothetical protein
MRSIRHRGLVHLLLLLAMFGGRAAVVADALRFHSSGRSLVAATVGDDASAVTESQSHECVAGSAVFNPAFVREGTASVAIAEPRLVSLERFGTPIPIAAPSGRSHQSRAPPLA